MELSEYPQEVIMKFEDRVKAEIKNNGNFYMESLLVTDSDEMRYESWLLTIGLLDTYITLKKVDLNDETY